MIIKLENRIVWDTELNTQSDEANEWFRNNILNKMAYSSDWSDKYVQPEYDKYQRPSHWCFEFDSFIVYVDREYINPDDSSWACKNDIIQFVKK